MALNILHKSLISFCLLFGLLNPLAKASPDWSAGAIISEPRSNIYDLSPLDLEKNKLQGKLHAQVYPVSVTGALPPYKPVRRLIEEQNQNPFRQWIQQIIRGLSGYNRFKDVLVHLGLHDYPASGDQGVYSAPYPKELLHAEELMGFGIIERNGAQGFTFSCAACHSANLFGKTVLGMTNRFPRANEFFIKAQKIVSVTNPYLFQMYTGATDAERELYDISKEHLRFVGLKQPIALGLDTSLAQVALSLNRRAQDDYASYSDEFADYPRSDVFLDNNPADSKPAVWWNVKYKNRWLSDGSVLSGNPIFTNIIWNELGRGVDLKELELWLSNNAQTIQELTTAVFSSEAPLITDFVPAEKIEIGRAKLGEVIFNNNCAKCHGYYDKNWSLSGAENLSLKDQLKTANVRYKETTHVLDVGTDAYRRLGMKSLEQLNNLAISKKNGIVIKAQNGYVPPPLVGIWARWPYFHNNSVPSLCAVLTRSQNRPVTYYSGEANNINTDFDLECNGYPAAGKVPHQWKTSEHLYDTRKKGMSNSGHDEKIFVKDGQEILSPEEKRNLIVYLQTL